MMQKTVYDASTGQSVVIDMTPEEEAAIIAAWPTPAQIAAAIEALREKQRQKLNDTEDIVRALALLVLEDRNLLAQKLNGIRQLAVTHTTFANFRTALIAAEVTPIYTEAQLLQAIKNRVGT